MLLNGGTTKKYGCSIGDCPYVLQFIREKPSQTRAKMDCVLKINQKVTKSMEHSEFCASEHKPSIKTIQSSASMRGSVAGNPRASFKEIAANALENDRMNLKNRKPATYKAKKGKCDETWGRNILDGFAGLPSYVSSYVRQNSGSYGVVQLNEDKSFCRSFVSNANAVATEASHLPAGGLDCASSKIYDYEGRYLSLVGRRSDGTNINIAFALIHAETMDTLPMVH